MSNSHRRETAPCATGLLLERNSNASTATFRFPCFSRRLKTSINEYGTIVQVFACTVVWSFSERRTRIIRLTDWTVLKEISSCVRGTKYRHNRAGKNIAVTLSAFNPLPKSSPRFAARSRLYHVGGLGKSLKNCPAGRNSAGTFKQTIAFIQHGRAGRCPLILYSCSVEQKLGSQRLKNGWIYVSCHW